MIGRLFARNDTSLEDYVRLAQSGDEETRNQLLKQYQPFIAKSVSEVCKRYIDPNSDDEYSIGLLAFDEAINSFSATKGSSFLSFAKLVIKRKVIDYIRNEMKQPVVASLDDEYYDEEQMENPSEIAAAKDNYKKAAEAEQRREEIKEFKQCLSAYKLSFEELTESSPKHRDARETAVQIARTIYNDSRLRDRVLEKGRIPMKDLVDRVEVSKKTLERNRKFILAIVLILDGDFVYLKDYIKGVGL
ncbi:RNA polymerase sigma-I factor [Thalassobacillus sp. CUG 92003]|uniref:RNA polymerase sigma-I factor n=1 Tax=Thalassobacillus sp. CUG 92003 TaxID=2736641 RepID=UPI0015E6E7B8|nr:RNA polymerase sigma-I factor [Thalassobacillus sp. CUG 92003]